MRVTLGMAQECSGVGANCYLHAITRTKIPLMSDEDEYLSEESYEFEFEDDEDAEVSEIISHSLESAVCLSLYFNAFFN